MCVCDVICYCIPVLIVSFPYVVGFVKRLPVGFVIACGVCDRLWGL